MYLRIVKLWFTLRASASAEAPESPILFPSRLRKGVHMKLEKVYKKI